MSESHVQTIRTTHGLFAVDMNRDKKIGARLREGKYHQEETLELVKMFIDSDSVVVDVGAHIGILAIPFAKMAGKVIAFEPSPESLKFLKKNTEQNAVSIDIRNKGLGFSAEHASLEIRSQDNAGANTLKAGQGSIEISTLDAEIKHADFIKIDVEGMEFAVLLGGKNLIKNSTPVILSEVNLSALRAHNSSPGNIGRLLRGLGYTLFFPIRRKGGDFVLGAIGNLEVLSACISPRAWFLRTGSAPFDILAIPKGKTPPLPCLSGIQTLLHALGLNLKQKIAKVGISL